MAKANGKASLILRGVKLFHPSPKCDLEAHKQAGFEYGLELADEIISETIIRGESFHNYFVSNLIGVIRSHEENALPEGFGRALVSLIGSLDHGHIAVVRRSEAFRIRSVCRLAAEEPEV